MAPAVCVNRGHPCCAPNASPWLSRKPRRERCQSGRAATVYRGRNTGMRLPRLGAVKHLFLPALAAGRCHRRPLRRQPLAQCDVRFSSAGLHISSRSNPRSRVLVPVMEQSTRSRRSRTKWRSTRAALAFHRADSEVSRLSVRLRQVARNRENTSPIGKQRRTQSPGPLSVSKIPAL